MDVTRSNSYQPLPSHGIGEFAHAPPVQAYVPAPELPHSVEVHAPERMEARDSLRRAVDEINTALAIHRRHLGIRIHKPTNRRVVTVYDSDTNEAIREIPPESVLEAHANMLEMVGLFLDKRG